MNNPYKIYLDQFFEKLLYYRHISGRINKVFQKDIKLYSEKGAGINFLSALIISDWTEPTEDGWELNFHSGIVAKTTKDNYVVEIEKIYSRQLCFLYAQSFESFEKYLKDCLFDRANRDVAIREYIISLLPKNQRLSISRRKMPSGKNLFKVLRKAGGTTYKDYSSNNNLNVKFEELWVILSEVRHSITHRESIIELNLINKSANHFAIFNFLFNSKNLSEDLLLIELDYKKFDKLMKRFSEFAFQIYKLLSVEENLAWNDKA